MLSGNGVEESYKVWGYGLQHDDQDPPIDYINIFLDILEPNFDKLKKIGINRDDISIWRIYEYKEICSMEIAPQETKRLGDNGITLCIDCFEK
ncbi:hypothetical protein FAZ19_07245 [Sphingobacterium alkalisoli]|uniref:DUF4279 domain-containing protein n=1 Tax=Sphingobacterium alkalisoli TaxID=1874115 RepID=A0A4U0H545_9SPHI|nr:hypothetical protein [Sphingobacterium alkalisoli]TJY66706.1 hypothetical protein FAZ19_07245 [Sphingobacterium alkalisoli]GGH14687.1 hypothetical protein GCM10011418_15810 [Sphingobacterium alkalisoli]